MFSVSWNMPPVSRSSKRNEVIKCMALVHRSLYHALVSYIKDDLLN
jgi:hypothetical protein